MLKGYKTVIFNALMMILMIAKQMYPETEIPDEEKIKGAIDMLDLIITSVWGIGNFALRAKTNSPIFKKDIECKEDNKLNKTIISIVFLCLISFVGCSIISQNVSSMKPKDKLSWMMGVYNAQYNDYQFVSSKPDLTEDNKKILKAKKEIMIEVYPLIKLYESYIITGSIINMDIENQILSLLNRLQGL